MGESTLGERLQASRMERQMSLTDVAEATKINPIYLMAMERNELHLLPAAVYVRGYIRSLGQLFGLEVTELYSTLPPDVGGFVSLG